MLRALPVLFVAAMMVAFASEARAEAPAQPIVIGMELNYPPFEMTNAAGEPSGIGVEMAHALADYLHRPLQIENMPFEGLIPALKTGRIDLIISSMTATAERAKSIDFSDPYLSTGLSILAKKSSPIQGIADVDKPGMIVVVKTGTTAQVYTRDHFHNATVLPLEQDTACALEVVQGRADAFLYDQMSIYQFAKKNPDTTRGLLEPFQKESWAIGIRKGNDALEAQVNAFLKDFKGAPGLRQARRQVPEGRQGSVQEDGLSVLLLIAARSPHSTQASFPLYPLGDGLVAQRLEQGLIIPWLRVRIPRAHRRIMEPSSAVAPPTVVSSEDKILAIVCHLSFLVGGLGFLLLPLVIFLVKRETSAFVAFHAREALNFHLSLMLYIFCTIPVFILLACFVVILIPIYAAMGIFALVCAIIAAVRASESVYYQYPLTIRLV